MDIELTLLENYEIQNIGIKYLFNSYMNIEKEKYALKNNKWLLKEENSKVKQDNNNLKMEIEIMKNKKINDIGRFQIKIWIIQWIWFKIK